MVPLYPNAGWRGVLVRAAVPKSRSLFLLFHVALPSDCAENYCQCLIAAPRSTVANVPRLGIFWQFLGLLCHFEAGQQFHITWCAAGCDKAIALFLLSCAVLAPVFLNFVARVFLLSLVLLLVSPTQACRRADSSACPCD